MAPDARTAHRMMMAACVAEVRTYREALIVGAILSSLQKCGKCDTNWVLSMAEQRSRSARCDTRDPGRFPPGPITPTEVNVLWWALFEQLPSGG